LIGVAVAFPLWLDVREKEYTALLLAEFLPSTADISNLSQGISPDAPRGTRRKTGSMTISKSPFSGVMTIATHHIADPSKGISITCNLDLLDLWDKGLSGRKRVFGVSHPEFLLYANRYVLWMMAHDGHGYALDLAEEALSGWRASDNEKEKIEAKGLGTGLLHLFASGASEIKHSNETGRAIESLAKIYWEIEQLNKSEALFLELLHRNQKLWPDGTDGHQTTKKNSRGGTTTTFHHRDQRSVSVTQMNLDRLRKEMVAEEQK